MDKYILFYLLSINILLFICMGIDKSRAMKNKWRIPENTLMLLAIAGGSIGGIAGMYLFRHKTKHTKFKIGFPIILLLQIGILIYFYCR